MDEADARQAERRFGASQIYYFLRAVQSHSLDYFFECTFEKPPFRGNQYTAVGQESEIEFGRMWADVPGVRFNERIPVMAIVPEDDVCGSRDPIHFAVQPDVWMPDYIVEIKTTCPASNPYPTNAPMLQHKAQLLTYMAFTQSTRGTVYNAQWYRDKAKNEWVVRSKNFHYSFAPDELQAFYLDLRNFIRRVLAQPKRLSEMKAEATRLLAFIRKKELTTEERTDFHFTGSFDDSTYLASLLEAVSRD